MSELTEDSATVDIDIREMSEFKKSMRKFAYDYDLDDDDEESPAQRWTWITELLGVRQLTQTLANEYNHVKFELRQSFLGNRAFHIAWAMYIIFMSILGGAILQALDGGSFFDSWFDATSCFVNSGLTVVSMSKRSRSGIAAMAILMLSGSATILLLPTLIYRCHKLKKLLPKMNSFLERSDISRSAKEVIRNHKLLHDGSFLMIGVILLYMLIFLVGGALLLFACLASEELEPYLRERGYTHWQNAMFTSVSAFTNSGIVLSPSSLVYPGNNNSPAIFIISIILLSGNVLLPVFLRMLVVICYKTCKYFQGKDNDTVKALKFVLNYPRLITTVLFDYEHIIYLMQFFLLSNVVLFGFIAVITFTEGQLLEGYGSPYRVAYLALFQILNARHAGFSVFDFRDFPQSVLFVYAIAMFVGPIPFIGVLHASGKGNKPQDTSKQTAIFLVIKKLMFRVWFFRLLLVVCVAACEDGYMRNEPEVINLWLVIFEIISAYSLVGVSVSAPNTDYSLSGRFTRGGKFFIILAFVFGKNRALPETTDPVIQFSFPALEQVLGLQPCIGALSERKTDGCSSLTVTTPMTNKQRERITTGSSDYELNARTPSIYRHF